MTDGNGRGRGKAAVRAAIEGAAPARPSARGGAGHDERPMGAAKDTTGGRFQMRAGGLFRLARDAQKETDLWICAPFDVLAETRDEAGESWGLLLRVTDRDGVAHELAIPRRSLAGEGVAVRELLADCGLSLNPAPAARQALMEYLNGCASPQRARCVPRIGWHRMPEGALVYLLPDEVFGSPAERVILQTEDRMPHAFGVAGTLDEWKAAVGALCAGNSRLLFAASCAFAAPLLELLGEDGGGVHLIGRSSVGKSAAARVAASVCGGGPREGAKDYWRSWRATANGTEGVAALHNDGLLILDEIGEADPREVPDVAYMLGNGQGKTRLARTSVVRPQLRWRLLFLSTGEEGLAEKAAEAGRRMKAGQEVRLIHVPADAGAGRGLFEELHGYPDGDAFAKAIEAATRRLYGTPLRAFLRWLAAEVARDEGAFRAALRARADDLLHAICPAGADGQVRRMARRMAVVALAGELAAEQAIAPWPETDATAAATACFAACLAERGTAGAREDAQAVAALRAFLSLHGPSRFELWRDVATLRHAEAGDEGEASGGSGGHDLAAPPSERYRTVNRAGWRRWVPDPAAGGGGFWRYYLTAEGMKEALRGLNEREAKRVLVEAGFIVVPEGASAFARVLEPPGHKAVRLYEVSPEILATAEGDA